MPDGTSEFDYALSPEETRDWDEGNTTDFVSLMTKIMVSFTRGKQVYWTLSKKPI